MSATLLTLDFGKPLPEGEPSPWRETYELVDTVRAKADDLGKEHFRLIALHSRNGAALGLRYDHLVATGPYAGEEVLSDIISKQGETVVAHVGTQIDLDTGRIRALWEIKDGKLVRQLAAYDHDDHGDLIRAQDENGAGWGTSTTATSSPATPTGPDAASTSPTTPASTAGFTPKRFASGQTTAATTPGSNGTRTSA